MEQLKIEYPKPVSSDDRGAITDLLSVPIKHITLITAKKGSVRGDHYHKIQTQYSYIISGKMVLKTKDLRIDNAEVKSEVMTVGCVVTLPPMVAHSYAAVEDSVFLALTTEHRIGDGYEEDTYRIDDLK